MPKLEWDKTGERQYETGTDRGVLYPTGLKGIYENGVAWNGLTKVTESPEGAEETALYADNGKYLSLTSAENFKGTIEAYTYPDEFAACDGSAEVAPGVTIGLQNRRPFGFSYRTLVGNDTEGQDLGYKVHLVYAAKVAPSERAYETVNDSPSAITFSWGFTTTPVNVSGFKPTAYFVFDSTKVDEAKMQALEEILYGSDSIEPKLPTPDELLALLGASTTSTTTTTTTING